MAYEDISDTENPSSKGSDLSNLVQMTVNGGGDLPPVYDDVLDTRAPPTDQNHAQNDVKTMADELARAHEHIRLLETRLQESNARNLQLENQNASGCFFIKVKNRFNFLCI